jgi:hypothetical protein
MGNKQVFTITFAWERVYNNGAIDNTEAGATSASDFLLFACFRNTGNSRLSFLLIKEFL